MIQIILFKRGRSGVVEQYTGPLGELVYDRGRKALRLHDNDKLGGHLLRNNAVATERPVIISPSSGAVDLPRQLTITAAPYEGEGEHTATRWQASLDPSMAESVIGSDWDSDNLTTVQITCPANSDVYLRCQFQIDGEWATGWSETIQAKITAEWLTFFTAMGETSHLTEISRTTSVTTQLLGYKQTFSINSRQTYVEGGNYSRNTSRSTSTNWSTVASYSNGGRTTSYSVSQSTGISRNAHTYYSTTASGSRNTTYSAATGNPARWMTEYQGSKSTGKYTGYWYHNGAQNVYTQSYTSWQTSEPYTAQTVVTNYTSYSVGTGVNTTIQTYHNTSWISYRSTTVNTSYYTSWSSPNYRSTSRSTATAIVTSWQAAGGYQNVYETSYWQTATYSPAQTDWTTTFNSATYYETQVETSVYTS